MIKYFSIFFYFFLIPTLGYSYTIALDVGHTKAHQGSISASGVGEYIYNKRIAYQVKNELESWGVDVLMIEVLDIHERVFIANKKSNLFISFHHDSMSKKIAYRFSGFAIFLSKKNPKYRKGLALAREISDEMLRAEFPIALYHVNNKRRGYSFVDKERGIYQTSKLVVVKDTTIPAILIECGVIANVGEEEFLNLPETQKKLSLAISGGIKNFIRKN